MSSLPPPRVLTLLQPERLEPLEGRNRAVSGFGLLSDSMVRVQPREGARASFAGGALAGAASVRSGVWVFSLLVGSVNSGRAGVLRLVTELRRQAPVGSGGSARVGTECHVALGGNERFLVHAAEENDLAEPGGVSSATTCKGRCFCVLGVRFGRGIGVISRDG